MFNRIRTFFSNINKIASGKVELSLKNPEKIDSVKSFFVKCSYWTLLGFLIVSLTIQSSLYILYKLTLGRVFGFISSLLSKKKGSVVSVSYPLYEELLPLGDNTELDSYEYFIFTEEEIGDFLSNGRNILNTTTKAKKPTNKNNKGE